MTCSRFACFAGSCLVAIAGPVSASPFHEVGAIDAAVAAAQGAAIGSEGGARAPVDRRLKLRRCPEDLAVSGPVLGAAVVRCASLGWALRVPLVSPQQPGSDRGTQQGAQVPMAAAPVIKGQSVRLLVEGAGFVLSRPMIADNAGHIGDIVTVRADRRGKPVMARVTAPGEVRSLQP